MLILLTNDDGIFSPGLAGLYRELVALGEVQVVAPASVESATSHGITLKAPLLTSRVTIPGAFTGTAVDGRPADCVKLAVSQVLPRRPDLMVSGINAGANVGINVLYSGTVAAAIEGAFLGLPSIAVSQHLRGEASPDYGLAAKLARETIEQILAAGLGPRQVATVNLPVLKTGESPAGVKIVRQCTRAWGDTYERRRDPRGHDYFWNTSVFALNTDEEDTDVAALRDGYVTITPLQFDLTNHALLGEWSRKKWSGFQNG
ncbi:MAG: 5'/3'-nucleotidase SurE [Tepidisphaeraceae bacterium]